MFVCEKQYDLIVFIGLIRRFHTENMRQHRGLEPKTNMEFELTLPSRAAGDITETKVPGILFGIESKNGPGRSDPFCPKGEDY